MPRENKPEHKNTNKFTRRDFLKLSGGLVISVTFAELLSACAPEATTLTKTATKTTTKTDLNTVVNTLTETATSTVKLTETATTTLTDTVTKTVEPVHIKIGTTFPFDELVSIIGSTGTFLRMWYHSFCAAPFLEYDENGYIMPHIMTGWEVDEDDDQILIATFATDKGITWHDGHPLTIDDILFTFEYRKTILTDSLAISIESIEKIDETTLKMAFTTTAFTFINNLASGAMCVYPKHIWENITDPKTYTGADAAIGCGPYKYTGSDKDAQILYFEAVNSYFKGELTVKKVSVRSYGSTDSLILALKSGEVDAMNNYSSSLDASAAPSVTGIEGLDPGESINISNYQLTFGYNRTPTDDLQFRKATRYALDYTVLASAIGGEIPGTGIIPSTCLGYDSSLPKLEQDIELAKSILDEAGYIDINNDGYRELPSGEPMDVVVLPQYNKSKGVVFSRIAEIIVSSLNAVGINATVDQQATADKAYVLSITRAGTYQLYVGLTSYVWAKYKTAFSYMVAGGNPTLGTCNTPEVLDAYAELMGSRNTEEYIDAVKSLQRLAGEDVFGLALCWDKAYFPYRIDKYEGWINYPGNGVINSKTWYNVVNK